MTLVPNRMLLSIILYGQTIDLCALYEINYFGIALGYIAIGFYQLKLVRELITLEWLQYY